MIKASLKMLKGLESFEIILKTCFTIFLKFVLDFDFFNLCSNDFYKRYLKIDQHLARHSKHNAECLSLNFFYYYISNHHTVTAAPNTFFV